MFTHAAYNYTKAYRHLQPCIHYSLCLIRVKLNLSLLLLCGRNDPTAEQRKSKEHCSEKAAVLLTMSNGLVSLMKTKEKDICCSLHFF